MLEQVLVVVVLLGNGLVAGVLFAVALSVMPALIALPADRYVQTHKLLGRYYDRVMPFIVASAVIGDVVLALRGAPPSRIGFAMAAVLLVGVMVVSQTRNVPINNRVKRLDPAAMPVDWDDPRLAWRNWNLLRTAFAVLALVTNASAVAWA